MKIEPQGESTDPLITIFTTQIPELLAIVEAYRSKEFKEYFYEVYGNTAFTEEDMFTIVKFFNDYREEKAEKEKEAEKEAEGGEEEDPLAGV